MPRSKIKYLPVKAYVPISAPSMDLIVKGTDLKSDCMRVLFHQFYMQRLNVMNKSPEGKNYGFDSGWLNLHSATLKRLVGPNYKDYIDRLLEVEVVEVYVGPLGEQKYLAGSYSQLYRIVNKYLHKSNSPYHFRRELITTRSILKSIKKVKDEAKAYKIETINRLTSHSEKIILSYLDMFYIDLKGLSTYVQQMLSGEVPMIVSKKDRVIDPGDLLLIADGINNFNLNWKKRDAFGERIHTPFTNLFKEFRPFIRIVGVDDELVTLDLSNSQPYFSSIAIHPNVIREVIPEFSPCIRLLSHLPQKEDFINYSSLCARGELYLYWGRLRGFSGDDEHVREQGKDEMFTLLFRSNHEPKIQIMKEAVDLFKEHFPSVHAAFREIKNLNEKALPFISSLKSFRNKRGKIALYYKNLSCMMQRIESRIILDRVAPELIKAGITPFVTVHDSFMLPVKYQEQAKEIIEKVFTDLGVNPPHLKT